MPSTWGIPHDAEWQIAAIIDARRRRTDLLHTVGHAAGAASVVLLTGLAVLLG